MTFVHVDDAVGL